APDLDRNPELVGEYEQSIAACAFPAHELLVPQPQVFTESNPALQGDIREGIAGRESVHPVVDAAGLVLLDLQAGIQPAALGESPHDEAGHTAHQSAAHTADIHQGDVEIEGWKRIESGQLKTHDSVTSMASSVLPKRMRINSKGTEGATTTSTSRRP